ncbi:signal peptidase I [Oceanivirga salmonicida]|uniref:signal peptidase I n=1 Tax=Oceanivirga salmonicida TaxID=1769291 RepID=UPI0008376E55|nr:signal peptidase I [Oceanivirga salmonicida]
MLFWIIFYIITAGIIILFFINEKFLTLKINNVADSLTNRLGFLAYNNKNVMYGINILGAITVLGMYIFFMDKSVSRIIPIKIYALNITIILNLFLLLTNKFRKSYLFIIDFIMYFASTAIFGIDDKYFDYTMLIIMVLTLIHILIDNEKLKENMQSIFNGIFVIFLIFIVQNHYLGNYVIPTQSMEPTILVGDRIFSNNIIYKFKDIELNDMISFNEPLEDKVLYTKRITGIAGTTFDIKDNRVYSNDMKINDRYYSFGKNSVYSLMKNNNIIDDTKLYIPKKGDEVKMEILMELDTKTNLIHIYKTPSEFIEKLKGKNYKEAVGLYNLSNDRYKYSYILKAKGHDELVLPILDFKNDKAQFEKLLNGEYIKLDDDYYMAMGDNTDNSQDSRYFGYIKKSRIKGRLSFRWFPISRIGFLDKNE